MSSTPVSDFARSDGCLNVASYTTKGDAKSDLGDVSQVYYQSGWLSVATAIAGVFANFTNKIDKIK